VRSTCRALGVVLVVGLAAACGDNIGAPDGVPSDAWMSIESDGPPPPGDPAVGVWDSGFEMPGVSGFGARVEDIAIDGDGSIVVAGIFADAAGLPALDIARWDGSDWSALADGLDGWVKAIEFDAAGTLWAAVTASDVSSGALARWTGTAWETANTTDGAIHGLAIVDDGIAVAGDFTGGVRVLDPADDQWTMVAPGGVNGSATAIAATTGDGFCVAGSFDSIDGVAVENAACWDGADWTALGVGLPGGVATLVRSPGGEWFAGGTLTFIVDPMTGEYEAGVGHLVGGTWQPFQGGIDNGFINEVRAIAFAGDAVYVGGHFQDAGPTNVPATHLAEYTPGGGWRELGGGLLNDVGVFLPYIVGAGDIAVASDGSLWVGGLFTRAGAVPAVNVARIPTTGAGSALVGPRVVLGVGGFVDTVTPGDASGVIAGGGFAFAGQTLLDNVGILDGETWTPIGPGITGIVRDAIVLYPGARIAVAGELFIDGAPAAYAEWNGTSWEMPGGRVDGVGFALEAGANRDVWLGGDLFAAGATPLGNLAHLSNETWTADAIFDGRVSALAMYGGELVAGGSFTMVDATPASAIAVRDAAGTWSELGGGIDGAFGYVNAIAVATAPQDFSFGIVIGGEFDGVGGQPIPDLARFDGMEWSDLSTGFTTTDFTFVSALRPHFQGFGGTGVFVAGGFSMIGGIPASNIAWFDGTAWHALGAGLADLAEEMVVIDDVLVVGGPFTAAGGKPSSGIARWDFRRSTAR
jgi:hypothetical protein